MNRCRRTTLVRYSVAAGAGVLAVFTLAACEAEAPQRTTRSVFDAMPGMTRGGGPDDLAPALGAAAGQAGASDDLDALTIKNPDGTVTLRAPQIRHAIYHLRSQLLADDGKLLASQVLSRQTRARFEAEGRTIDDAAALLRENRKEILRFLARMPSAENSPGTIISNEGGKQFRIRLVNTAAKNLAFTEVWVELEGADWKVVWVR